MFSLNIASVVALAIVLVILTLAIMLIIYQNKKDDCKGNCSRCNARSVCPNRR